MQLVAYGAQDIYLTGNPQITFFKVVYRRHTNFSMEAIEQTWNGTVAASGRTSATISRNGDLVHRMYLEYKAGTSILNESATQLNNITLEIGGQQIDKHYGHWMEVWSELTENTTGREFGTRFQNMASMGQGVVQSTAGDGVIGDGGASAVFFSFPNLDSSYVYCPLFFWFCRNPGLALPLIALQYHEVKVIAEWGSTVGGSEHKLWADYIYLDTDERRRFAQVSHEYLIEQLQFQDSSTAATSHDLNFNHPVKELIWTGGALSGGIIPALSTTETDTYKLVLNGHDRFAPRYVTYFTRTQVWEHHTGDGLVNKSVAVYSFALKPEEHQPSGTCNFSRIDNAQLQIASGSADGFYIYAVNYNVLRIMSGMGGLAYSN